MQRQRKQTGLFFREDVRNGSRGIARPGSGVRQGVSPGERLTIEILQGGEGTGGKERMADILDSSFNAPFFVASRRPAGARIEMIMSGHLENPGMELHGVTMAVQHDRS